MPLIGSLPNPNAPLLMRQESSSGNRQGAGGDADVCVCFVVPVESSTCPLFRIRMMQTDARLHTVWWNVKVTMYSR